MTRKLFPIYLVLTVSAIIMIFPFVWMVLTSFKSMGEITRFPVTFLPDKLQLGNYRALFIKLPYAILYLNTIVATLIRIFAQLFFCSMTAYAFAKISFPGKKILFTLILSVMMVPGQIYYIPQYKMVAALGLLDSIPALYVTGLVSAFGVFFLRQFFLSIPNELVDAAKVDGCNHFYIYSRIMIPLIVPALVTLGIFVMLWTWNDLMWPLIINDSIQKMTLASGLAILSFGEYATQYNLVMAGAAAATIPILIVFICLQKYYVAGIKLSGIK